jgi:phosphoribosylglycinamide formyltransferase-1
VPTRYLLAKESIVGIVVFASGHGSNFEAILNNDIPVATLVTNNPGCRAEEIAKSKDIPVASMSTKVLTKRHWEETIVSTFTFEPDLIVLAGFMKILSPWFVNKYHKRIINTHPSLLPSFPGLNAVDQALGHGVKITGCTVHYVDEGVDTGEIIAQEAVRIVKGETEESLAEKIKKAEHVLLPKVIKEIANV